MSGQNPGGRIPEEPSRSEQASGIPEKGSEQAGSGSRQYGWSGASSAPTTPEQPRQWQGQLSSFDQRNSDQRNHGQATQGPGAGQLGYSSQPSQPGQPSQPNQLGQPSQPSAFPAPGGNLPPVPRNPYDSNPPSSPQFSGPASGQGPGLAPGPQVPPAGGYGQGGSYEASPYPGQAPTAPPAPGNFYAQPGYNQYQGSIYPTAPNDGVKTLSLTSMIFGIGALFFTIVFPLIGLGAGITAVILGHKGLRKEPAGRGMAIAGLITGYIGLGISAIICIFALFFIIVAIAAGTSSYR